MNKNWIHWIELNYITQDGEEFFQIQVMTSSIDMPMPFWGGGRGLDVSLRPFNCFTNRESLQLKGNWSVYIVMCIYFFKGKLKIIGSEFQYWVDFNLVSMIVCGNKIWTNSYPFAFHSVHHLCINRGDFCIRDSFVITKYVFGDTSRSW
jgi:hypothetical protein